MGIMSNEWGFILRYNIIIDKNSIIGGVEADDRKILINKWRSYYSQYKE